ncbi:rod shape-determining protein MreC [Solitalea koreensis]|uniref:Cell shape-determining protein MreC n=1 Tax=Solitalea koreensis TaxID=543615 RepID=A0A521CXY1_9SPHI|nr:rod shape-determining protein MreC [Solitalea koreensis]SMO64288.1 rod shape-determining protein MreC [Solitalea koreensis]
MRNLWLFIVRFHAFFLFIIFEAIALILLVKNNNYQKATVVNSSNQYIGNIYQTANNISSYLQLGRVNDSLSVENTTLRNQLRSVYYNDSLSKKTVRDTIKADSNLIRQYTYINAKVINNTISYQSNYITLNRGSRHGVKAGMGVICPDGIVGIVKDVSDHFCTVVSLLHKDMKISAKLLTTNEIGSIVWDGKNPRIAILKEIPNHVVIKVGEKVVTTGYSLFPEDVMIGKVISQPLKAGESLLNVQVLLSTDFQRLQYVYIVEDKLSAEKQKLEEPLTHD